MNGFLLAVQNPASAQNTTFDQCIINKYEPGQGIGAHSDSAEFDDIIGCFTLCTDAEKTNVGCCNQKLSPGEMKFQHPLLQLPPHKVLTEHGSLYIMPEPSRSQYTHCMIGRRTDMIDGVRTHRAVRISINFRSLKVR